MRTRRMVALALVVGCKTKGAGDDWPARANAWLSEIRAAVAERDGSTAAFACKEVEISEDNQAKHPALAAELDALCGVDVHQLVLETEVEYAEQELRKPTPEMTSRCSTATFDEAIDRLDKAGKLAELRPVFARLSVACPDYQLRADLVPTEAEVLAIPMSAEEIAAVVARVEGVRDKIAVGIASKDSAFLVMPVCEEARADIARLRAHDAVTPVAQQIETTCTLEAPIAAMKWFVDDLEEMKTDHPSDGASRWCYMSDRMRATYAVLQPIAVDRTIEALIARWNAICGNEVYRVPG